MIGGMSENQISRKLVSSSVTYYQDDITWYVRLKLCNIFNLEFSSSIRCVAKAGLAPKWMNVFIIFNSKF